MKYDANGKPIADEPPNLKMIEWGNQKLFEKYCRAEGIDPTKSVTSPVLRRLIAEQNEKRAAIDAEETK
jgi:hypothetical protein